MGGEGVLVAAPDELWTDDGRIHRIDGHYPQGWTGCFWEQPGRHLWMWRGPRLPRTGWGARAGDERSSCSVPDSEGELGDLFVDLPALLHLG
jgi:hypothetical protein